MAMIVPNSGQSRCRWRACSALALSIFSHGVVHGQGADLSRFEAEARENARGYEWLAWSTTAIGHRLTGSPQGVRAQEVADSLFRVAGVERVSQHPFTAQAWARGTVMLRVGDGTGTEHLAAVALAQTPDSADVEGELLDLGNGLAEQFAQWKDRVAGRVVLMNIGLVDAPQGTGNLHRSEKAALAIRHGAIGIVFVNNVEGGVLLTGTASIDGATIPVPAACIASEDGLRMRERLKVGASLRIGLRMTNHIGTVQARNVVAEIPGSDLAHEVVMVGGHLDSWDLATGATDNGLGAFSIVDMARAVVASGHRPRRTLRFVLFMGEEQGLLGSEALVADLKASGELGRVRCMVNMDMTGDPFGFGVVGPAGWGPLVDTLMAPIHALDTVFRKDLKEQAWLHSDHQSFLLAGVPVINPLCDLGGHVYGCYHSSCDDVHLVDPRDMVNNVRFVGALLLQLADAPALPRHFTEAELGARLRADGLEEKLRMAGQWRW
ncbi:MAG TPA: M28 family peptidase [Flavobacteriales bacterium]|nr:M28 family peptidase [Flavobacteriales bacterium]